MEAMFSFVGIIIIVFGILQIILFFKMWGMTNDVKQIKEALPNTPSNLSPAQMEFIIGNTEKAKEIAKREFILEIYQIYRKALKGYITDSEYLNCFNSIENEYRSRFDNASSFIEFGKFSTFENAKKIFH